MASARAFWYLWGVSDLQDVSAALNATSKSLARIEEDMACTASALEGNAEALEGLAAEVRNISEVVAPLADLLPAIQTLTNSVVALTERFNKYVDSTAEQNGALRGRLTRLELRLGER